MLNYELRMPNEKRKSRKSIVLFKGGVYRESAKKDILRLTQFSPTAAKVIRNFGGCGTRPDIRRDSDSPRHPSKTETEIAQELLC